MRLGKYISILIILAVFFASCERAEDPVPLPPKGSAQIARVVTGEDYEDQVFFDFESGQIVATNKVRSWDLAFEAGATGYHVFMNGDNNIYVYNAQTSDVSSITSANSLQFVDKASWKSDAACGLPDSTGVGEWRDATGKSKEELYIVKFDKGMPSEHIYKKFIVKSVSSTEYVLLYGELSSSQLETIVVPKSASHSFVYFSFDNGGTIVNSEPPKDTWDIVFTHYRYFYHDMSNFPYLVSGVLLNAHNTEARLDSTTPFASVVHNSSLSSASFSNHRDAIGWTWKKYNFTNGLYEVNTSKVFVVRNRKGQYWKMRFLDFYYPAGIKGSPSFEYERIY
jgi:hypothetical protein